MSKANETIIREGYEHFARGDVAAVLAALDAPITWHVLGQGPLSGTFRGHEPMSASFPEVHVWRLQDGRVTEFREYQGDEHREDRFWS